jgi:2'-5' RNA ligase
MRESMNKYDYGCLMLKLPIKNWDVLLSKINKEDVYNVSGYGLEVEPHATILYGFTDEVNVKDIKDAVYAWVKSPISLSLENVSAFDTSPTFDVIKIDIKSNSLHKLNTLFQKFPHESMYPTYQPHATIAYLKKGTFPKYKFKLSNPISLKVNTFIYSTPGVGKRYEWTNDKRLHNDVERLMKTGPWSL